MRYTGATPKSVFNCENRFSIATSTGVSWINLTFAQSGAQTYARGSGYSLVDGSYTLCLHGVSLLDRAGSPTADRTDHFFRFFGDADDDRNVSDVDLTLFRRVTTADVRYAALRFAFDYDGDGTVGASDYRQFRLRYGRRLRTE